MAGLEAHFSEKIKKTGFLVPHFFEQFHGTL